MTHETLVEREHDDWSCWDQWFDRCALEKCDDDVQRLLAAWCHGVWNDVLRAASYYVYTTPAPLECWGYLENHLLTGEHRSGKVYKQHTLDAVREKARDRAHALNSVHQNLGRRIRAIVRKKILLPPDAHCTSLDVCGTGPDGEEVSHYEKLAAAPFGAELPPELSAVEQHEYRELAAGCVADIFNAMTLRHRVALTVRLAGSPVPLHDPRVLDAAGCKRSQLYVAFRKLDDWLLEQVKQQSCFAHEDPRGILFVRCCIIEAMIPLLKIWMQSENSTLNSLLHIEPE